MARAVRRILVVVAVVLLLAETTVRVVAARLPEPLTWYHPSAQVKVEQMDRMQTDGVTVEYVLAGTSQMAEGADPLLFSDLLPGRPRTYNAAVLAGYPVVNRRFLPEEVVPRLHPKTVVYGVALTDLQPDKEPPYDTSPATDTSAAAGVDRFVSRYSELVRHRRELRDPVVWGSLLSGGQGGQIEYYRQEVVGEWGTWKLQLEQTCRAGPSAPAAAGPVAPTNTSVPNTSVADTFVADPRRVEAFWATVTQLQAADVRVIVAVMPFPDCSQSQPGARAVNADARRQIAAGATRVGAPLIDLTDEIHDDSLFADQGHLNRVGKRRFTELLAAAVNRLTVTR